MKIYPNIFKINKNHFQLKRLSDAIAIIKHIVQSSYEKDGIKPTKELDEISTFKKDEFQYHLFLFNSDEKESDWAEFLPNELTAEKKFIQQKVSLILFVETEFDIYAIVGGSAYRLIVNFIDHSFGLDTYDKIVQPNADELTSIKSRGITGQRIGMNEQFRDDYRIVNFIKFGKLPQELHVKLSKQTSDLYFGFLKEKETERIQVTAGKGFKIRKSVDFDELHRVFSEMCTIMELEQSEYLSSYRQITNYEYIDKTLWPNLVDKIYNNIPYLLGTDKDKRGQFDFDFCNPNNIEKFYEAEKYELKEKTVENGHKVFATVADRNEIYRNVIEGALASIGEYDKFKFKVFLQGVRICSVNGGKVTDGAPFLLHISAEFSIDGISVFLIDGKWYRLKDMFLNDLKVNTQHILKEFKATKTILTEKWDKETMSKEGDYNLLYNNKPNYIVIDTIIVDGIELCDIIHYDDENIYLIHVKHGFGSQVRELTNQILISARRLRENLGTEKKTLLEKIYKQLVQKDYDFNNLSLGEFKELFNKKIIYVLAIASNLKEDVIIEEHIDKYTSNIARFSLIQCSSEMRTNYYDMQNIQIRRT